MMNDEQAAGIWHQSQQIVIGCLWLLVAVAGRLAPHLNNFTPFMGFCVLSGRYLRCDLAIGFVATALLISDGLLSWLTPYGLFGSWSFFTYSGFVGATILASWWVRRGRLLALLSFGICATLGFWLWTNLGAWWFMPVYAKNMAGILQCYTMAMPFLQHSLLATVLWLPTLYGALKWQYAMGYKWSFLSR